MFPITFFRQCCADGYFDRKIASPAAISELHYQTRDMKKPPRNDPGRLNEIKG